MFGHGARRARFGPATVAVGALALLMMAGSVWGQAGAVVRVEQDWELSVGEPDPQTDAPQVVCVISPGGDTQGVYAAFELNQQSQPVFSAGGMQLQVWEGELPLKAARAGDLLKLQAAGEHVCWTLVMELDDGQLTFQVCDGHSATWGEFGGEGLRASVATAAAHLNGYDTQVSVRNSGVGFAPNRVHALTLKRIRTYFANGEVVEDRGEKVVHYHD